MSDEDVIRNEAGGTVTGAVVQAGSIGQVTLAGVALPGPPPTPRQLPPRIRDFVGRVDAVAALDALLPATDNDGVAGAVVISAVDGLPGVGKTALAVCRGRIESKTVFRTAPFMSTCMAMVPVNRSLLVKSLAGFSVRWISCRSGSRLNWTLGSACIGRCWRIGGC
jgi:hypothetical protein